MKTNIVSIGNSQGIRIPKVLLELSGLAGEVELELCENGILISKARRSRDGWGESFRQMAENNDDELTESFQPTVYAKEKWRW